MLATVYEVVPSANVGLNFNPNGGDFGMVNVVLNGPIYVDYDPPSQNRSNAKTPLYLLFGVAKGAVGADGIIRYQPDPSRFQVYIVDQNNKVILSGQFLHDRSQVQLTGESKTSYYFYGNLELWPNYQLASVFIKFDTSLPPGKEITGGQFLYFPHQ